MPLFPIFVKLEGRSVLLVGAGPVGEAKVGGLLSSGAKLTVVAPIAAPGIRRMADQGTLLWYPREFRPRDLDGMALVVAAVPKDVALSVYRAAHARNIFVNSVDDPDNCDFYYPAVVSRG